MPTTALFERAHHDGVNDDPAARPRRRQFSAEYKLGVLEEYDRLTDPGAKGALLRREGLYSSHIVEWRRARDVGALKELGSKTKPKRRMPEQVEIERLRRRNERLEADLAKHRLALEIQGKASALLERLLAESDDPPRFLLAPPVGPPHAQLDDERGVCVAWCASGRLRGLARRGRLPAATMTVPLASRSANLLVWAVLFGAIVLWQGICLASSRLPSLGAVVELLQRWRPSRWALLAGWFWLGWHAFVRGSW
jgi:transposase-like protein